MTYTEARAAYIDGCYKYRNDEIEYNELFDLYIKMMEAENVG